MRTIHLIRILASFPMDVQEEADQLLSIADELNRTIGAELGFSLRILNWQRDTRSGIGKDVQSHVNAQFGDDFDAVIGTFWGRAGTPTPRAESGSIEEIRRAVERHKSDGRWPQVLVYFKTQGLDPTQIEETQIGTLNQLRKWLGENGILYKTFSDTASYGSILRVELSRLASDIIRQQSVRQPKVVAEDLPSDRQESAEEEFGLLDYLDIQETAFARMTTLLHEQTEALQELTERNRLHTSEAGAQGAGGFDSGSVRRLLRRTAESWDTYSTDSEKRLSELEQATMTGFDAMSNAISLGASSGNNEARASLIQTMASLAESVTGAIETTASMRNATASFPKMTIEHNRAKRRLVAIMDKQISLFERTRSLAETMIATIDEGS